MCPDPAESICAALVSEQSILIWDDIEYWPESLLRSLVQSGLLVPREPATSVRCDACERDHVEAVERIDRGSGSVEFTIFCATAGRVTIAPVRLQQWNISFEAMARIVGRLLGTPGVPEVSDGDEMALIGEWGANGLTHDIWLARGPEHSDRLKSEGEARAVLLSARRPDWSDAPGPVVTVALSEVFSVDGTDFALDRERLARKVKLQLQLAGVTPGRPDGFYSPGTVVWQGDEHCCSLTHQQQRFMSAALMNAQIDIEPLMGPDRTAVWRGTYTGTRKCRNKVSSLLSRLNAALGEADPPVPLRFVLPEGERYVRRVATDPRLRTAGDDDRSMTARL